MDRPKRLRAVLCGLLLASTGLAFADSRAVEIERRAGDEQHPGCWRLAARLATRYVATANDPPGGQAAVETVEPQRRVAMVPRAPITMAGAVRLRSWVLELRNVLFLLP